jgi:hypothetical protein
MTLVVSQCAGCHDGYRGHQARAMMADISGRMVALGKDIHVTDLLHTLAVGSVACWYNGFIHSRPGHAAVATTTSLTWASNVLFGSARYQVK